MKTSTCLIAAALLALGACTGTQKIQTDLLYGLWKVSFIETLEQRSPGVAMGNPQYEFTQDGKRIKTLNTIPAPPPEAIAYKINKDSIFYPDNPKLPAVKIVKLSKDSLILKSEKAEWHLYKDE